jgi:rare lipoprotein A
MSSIDCARSPVRVNHTELQPSLVSSARVRNLVQILALVLGAACLAACAQSSVVSQKSEMLSPRREASLEHDRRSPLVTHRTVAARDAPARPALNASPAETQIASHGLASFYTGGTQTASGEKFNTRDLTAAHPTLPFGTRLRVTNVTNGQSVTVRVNDRGPFVPGRVVDVSYSAAETLGMVEGGVAKVKLDVVH